jgi:GWxTD domain-containing protein
MKGCGSWLRLQALAVVALASACLTSQALKNLDDKSRDFLSKVRYIVTKKERERFLVLPADERPGFVEEFWKKRDPTPSTDVNEFKDQYFRRIAEANHLFSEAGEPGWLQDRGRVYILLGPPTNRITYPRGVTFYDVPREFWYYGFFMILFTDEAWNGNYKLDPLSVEQLSILNRAQWEWQPEIAADKEQIDFRASVKEAGTGQAIIEVAVPVREIRFDLKDKSFQVTFVVTLDFMDMDGKEIRRTRTEQRLEMTKDELRASDSKDLTIEIPIEAREGDYWLRVTLENANDGSKGQIRIKLSI